MISPDRHTASRFVLLSVFLALAGLVGESAAQTADLQKFALDFIPTRSISSNVVTNIHVESDSVWVGPLLDVSPDGGTFWYQADADSLSIDRGRVFSIDIEGSRVRVGVGYSQRVQEGGSLSFISTALGFLISNDGGRSWSFRFPQLDTPDDSTQVYGISTLRALPVIVPEQSPPFDIDLDPITGTLWTAAWASGIRRSEDDGRTWQRVVLPPDTLDEIRPDIEYNFVFAPERRPNEEANNFLGFSVLVDETGTVWAGTAGGLNRSLDARTVGGDASWRRFSYDGTPASLVGNWITSIEEQPREGRNPVWMACWPATEAGEDFGITVTRDGGETFEQELIGEKVYDFAFLGDSVLAAGDNGLFISADDGRTWQTVRYFGPDIRPDVTVFAVGSDGSNIWAGTDDGLVRSSDGGRSWEVIRTDIPLHPETPTARTPDVDSFAYPNPFAPGSDGWARFRYALTASGTVRVRLFDFGSNLVRTIVDGSRSAGTHEEIWDGTDDRGTLVANGVYFYVIETDEATWKGKLLVID
jgi:hypothetical protein